MHVALETRTSDVVNVSRALRDFIENEVFPGLSLDRARFWRGFDEIVKTFAPANAALLSERDRLQRLVQSRHALLGGAPAPAEDEKRFLRKIGYLHPSPRPFQIETDNVDDELSSMAAPQLVVPIDNARYALNAANARWGSLYDALYGADVIPGRAVDGDYDPARGDQVVSWVRAFLDQTFPLEQGSHAEVRSYGVQAGQLTTNMGRLRSPWQFAGYSGRADAPRSILLRNHGLHVELRIEPDHPVGRRHLASVADVLLESAASVIMDFEDSVAAVDTEDKIAVYRNWLGLMTGTLEACVYKHGRPIQRRLSSDRTYLDPTGEPLALKGRALMLARNVGMLMSTPLVLLNGQEVPEGIVDAFLTALIALHDIRGSRRNSATGSVYIVKPKLHGPDEAAFTAQLFDAVEDLLQLERNTIKIGVMDEERRTSLNLMAVIARVRRRIVFINTGFLDRTGDEIHTAMDLGPVMRKSEMKSAAWLSAYEDNNVDVGLACGFAGRAQIGKGMWTMPDNMAAMMEQKLAHPLSGASTAWAPSPTAATLHALHYHRVDVAARQSELADRRIDTDRLFVPPIADPSRWEVADIAAELDNNAQGILGYVARWVGQGVGCSKVPDLDGINLMEDRATCRISSQILANWLRHGVITVEMITETLIRMARIVDKQNTGDAAYIPMGDDPRSSHAFVAARDLILRGAAEPSGYTERILHSARLRRKADAP